MPLIEVTLAKGRPETQIRELMDAIHEAVSRTTGSPTPSIRVIVREVAPEHWLSGGQTLAEKAAQRGP
jgi:4-oxalocrotonate tautomerase